MLHLKVKEGPKSGHKTRIGKNALVLGSAETADIVLEARGVDPEHARVIFDGGKVTLEDLGSREGTFRNGQRLLAPVQVFPGDRIGLGPDVVLILEGDDPSVAQSEDEDDLGLAPGEGIEA